jgi:tetratricopeptide (TPR) repeat protein
MGAFFDSIHVRTENSDVVKKTLEQVAKEMDCKFLLGPPIKGWISIFPSEIGRKEPVSSIISQLIPNDIFHVMVHDDDVFYYDFYRNGKLTDRYNSCPDYFEEASEDEEQKCKGHPELFQDLLPDSKSLSKIQKLLAADKFTFESERIAQFVELLDLPNATSSYEYIQEGERDEIEDWKQFVHIEYKPSSAEDYNNRGAAKLVKEDLDGALADFNKAIELNPNLVVAYENRDRAIQSKNERNKTLAETWNQFGRIKKEEGDLDGALHGYDKAIELNPNFATAYGNRGFTKKAKGNLDGALIDFNKAIELNPDSGTVYNNRGLVKKEKNDLDGAMADFNKAIELEPNLTATYVNRGNIKRAKGDLNGALDDYGKAIELKPDSAGAYNSRGELKRGKGDLEGALQDYNKAIELKPDSAVYFSNRGLAKLSKRDLEGAFVDCNKAIELKPDFVVAYNNRGMVKQVSGNLDGALEDYNKAISLKPDFSAAISNRDKAMEIKNSKKL